MILRRKLRANWYLTFTEPCLLAACSFHTFLLDCWAVWDIAFVSSCPTSYLASAIHTEKHIRIIIDSDETHAVTPITYPHFVSTIYFQHHQASSRSISQSVDDD